MFSKNDTRIEGVIEASLVLLSIFSFVCYNNTIATCLSIITNIPANLTFTFTSSGFFSNIFIILTVIEIIIILIIDFKN